jgi:DNA-binding LacI/PurR family transcriptional regulator
MFKNSRPTIEDVAREAGVSIATVSRVLNNPDVVAPRTVVRVRTAIAALHYQPREAARMLARSKTNTIGLLLPEISGYFFFPMILGVEKEAHANGYSLLIHSALAEDSEHGQMPLSLGEHNTDGLIIFAHSLSESELRRLDALHLPMALLHQSPPEGLQIPNVTFENKRGARELVEHLIVTHGYRRIVFLAGPEHHEDSYWREMGYREALDAHGIPFDPALVARGDFAPDKAKQAVQQLLDDGIVFDAVFAADDESASGAMMALRDAGKRIPEDVAVVGFDDTLLAAHLTPPLTTVHAPIEDAGRQAVVQLLRRIKGEPAEAVTLLPAEVVIRQSCGCNP